MCVDDYVVVGRSCRLPAVTQTLFLLFYVQKEKKNDTRSNSNHSVSVEKVNLDDQRDSGCPGVKKKKRYDSEGGGTPSGGGERWQV